MNPGEDVLMTCKVFNKRGACSWQKDNKVGHSTKLPTYPSTLQQIYAALKRKEAVGKASKVIWSLKKIGQSVESLYMYFLLTDL